MVNLLIFYEDLCKTNLLTKYEFLCKSHFSPGDLIRQKFRKQKMTYYFPEKFEWSLDYFNAQTVVPSAKDEAQAAVEKWLSDNGYEQTSFYKWVVSRTLGLVDVDFDHGVFYYIHLNSYLRDTAYAVWNCVDERLRLEGVPEKERGKKTDAAQKAFVEFAKATFSNKAPKKVKVTMGVPVVS